MIPRVEPVGRSLANYYLSLFNDILSMNFNLKIKIINGI